MTDSDTGAGETEMCVENLNSCFNFWISDCPCAASLSRKLNEAVGAKTSQYRTAHVHDVVSSKSAFFGVVPGSSLRTIWESAGWSKLELYWGLFCPSLVEVIEFQFCTA